MNTHWLRIMAQEAAATLTTTRSTITAVSGKTTLQSLGDIFAKHQTAEALMIS